MRQLLNTAKNPLNSSHGSENFCSPQFVESIQEGIPCVTNVLRLDIDPFNSLTLSVLSCLPGGDEISWSTANRYNKIKQIEPLPFKKLNSLPNDLGVSFSLMEMNSQ